MVSLFKRNRLFTGCCILLLALICAAHLLNLGNIPRGLNIDEVGMAYDAWSIAQTGTDTYLNSWPVYFLNRGDGMSALYTYIEAGVIALFGVSNTGIRIPIALFSLLTLIAGGYIAIKLWPGRRLPFALYLLLFAASPYFIAYSRIALDCNLFLGCSTLLLATVVSNMTTVKPKWWISGLLAGITLYSYILSWIVVPLFLVSLIVYLKFLGKMGWREVAQLFVPAIIIGLPLIAMAALLAFKFDQFTVGPITVPVLAFARSGDFAFSLHNLTYFLWSTLLGDNLFKYYRSIFTPFQVVSIPFFFVGAFQAFKMVWKKLLDKTSSLFAPLVLWFSAYLLLALFLSGSGKQGPVMHQLNGIYFVVLVFILVGIVSTYDWMRLRSLNIARSKELDRDTVPSVQRAMACKLFVGMLVAIYATLLLAFCYDFFIHYPTTWDEGVTELHISASNVKVTADLDGLKQASEFVESLPAAICERPTYIRHVPFAYVYFFLARGITASDSESMGFSGSDKNFAITYKNYVFDKPDKYSLDENYIVAHWQGPELDELQGMGFSDVKRFGKYWVFVNP